MAFREAVGKSERGVGDLRILPRPELVDTAFVGDGHDVPGGARNRVPREERLSFRLEKTVVLLVKDLSIAGCCQHGLSRWNDTVDVVNVVEDDVGAIVCVTVFGRIETVRRTCGTHQGQLERHGRVAVGNVGLCEAGQVPLHPTERVVQRQRRTRDFSR